MDEKPKRGDSHPADSYPCPVCDGSDFTWGVTVDDSPMGRVYFRPHGGMWGEGRQLEGRACNRCGNVLLFVKD